MFGRKRKKALFGANIQPDCKYCRSNGAPQGDEPLCMLKSEPKDGCCKKYSYDPLRREPRQAPPLKNAGYSEEDFKL